MTSLLEAIADIRSVAPPVRTPPPPPLPSEPAVRLAMQLRDVPAKSGGRVFLFLPAVKKGDASPAVGEAVSAFIEAQEGPLLIVDLRAEAFAGNTPPWFDTLSGVEQTQLNQNVNLAGDTARISRPLLRRRDKTPYAMTPRFVEQLNEARLKYRYVLYIGDAVPSRDSLICAAAADGVVLSVPPGQTTRTEMHDLAAQLRRARARLLGFVVDPRATQRRNGK